MSGIEKWFEKLVEEGKIPQTPMNYDTASYKMYVAHLEAENAALKDRLEKAVELPCKVGDTVYFLEHFCDYKGHFNKNCSKSERPFMCECEELVERSRKNEQFVISEKPFALQDLPQVDKRYFVTHEAAEARQKELQGGK